MSFLISLHLTFRDRISSTAPELITWLNWYPIRRICLSLPPPALELQMFAAVPGFYIGAGDRNLGTHACATWHIMNLPISINLWHYFKHFLQCLFGGCKLIVWLDIEIFVNTHLLWGHKMYHSVVSCF